MKRFCLLFLLFIGFTQLSQTAQYCSMENNCPADKCHRGNNCAADGSGAGCAIGKSYCEWKSASLKERYQEISAAQAGNCLNSFVRQNSTAYPMTKYYRLQTFGEQAQGCNNLSKVLDPSDSYCWFASMQSPPPINTMALVQIGAQTCKVYWDLSDPLYKLISLDAPQMKINFTPEQAKSCAEKFVDTHRKYPDFKNYQPGTLFAESN